ncbi:MAG: hypothetical protein HKM06_04865, partial [Spirochaetales bacterium]|nr:hypothetical protein [Spirochaetales bacterium]
MKKNVWRMAAAVLVSFLVGCSSPTSIQPGLFASNRAAVPTSVTLTGANGDVVLSGMSGEALTVSFTPSTAISSATLYVTQGNGLGLVLAAQAMTSNAGTWSYSFSDPSFLPGAKIGLDIIQNIQGAELNIPQGQLSNSSTWSSFLYPSTSSVPTYTV